MKVVSISNQKGVRARLRPQ